MQAGDYQQVHTRPCAIGAKDRASTPPRASFSMHGGHARLVDMSLNVSAYVVDVECVQDAIGGGDAALERKVVRSLTTKRRPFFLGYRGVRKSGMPSLEQAVHAL